MNKRLILPAVIIFSSTILSAGFLLNTPERNSQHINILMREIGHRLLLAAGDSTSRVLPVKQTNDSIFQLSFEKTFTFEPDTLAKIVSTVMEREGVASSYLVSMIDCTADEIIYGFQVTTKKSDFLACAGRTQPNACYILQLTFMENTQASSGLLPSLGVLVAGTLLVLGLMYFNPKKTENKAVVAQEPTGFVDIGSYAFQPERGLLRYGGNLIELTSKEARVLTALAREVNTTVLREKLNGIWEDEGVITGRSLDVFVSKLRKRFVNDASIRIINVHGKGYRLEVGVETAP